MAKLQLFCGLWQISDIKTQLCIWNLSYEPQLHLQDHRHDSACLGGEDCGGGEVGFLEKTTFNVATRAENHYFCTINTYDYVRHWFKKGDYYRWIRQKDLERGFGHLAQKHSVRNRGNHSKIRSEVGIKNVLGHNFTCKTIAMIQLALGEKIVEVTK